MLQQSYLGYYEVCTGMYWYVLVCTGMYQYKLNNDNLSLRVCTSTYQQVLVFTLFCSEFSFFIKTGFRGYHRDAARQPAPADHASNQKVDSFPCAEDENCFEGRPDNR